MAVCWPLVISCIGALSGGSTSTAAGSQQTFYRVWADYGVERIGRLTRSVSASACAVRTKEMYPGSRSFMFNPFLNMCLPGGHLSRVYSKISDAEGQLFVELTAPPDLAVISQDETSACMGVFEELITHDNAAQRCEEMGYFLVSVKNLAKLKILIQLAGDRSVWVGCDDGTQEGRFVWNEDGSEVTDDTKTAVFSVNDPNKYLSQDCCLYTNDTQKLDDYDCSALYPYACEVSMDNCNLDISYVT